MHEFLIFVFLQSAKKMFEQILHSIDILSFLAIGILILLFEYRPVWLKSKKVAKNVRGVKDIPGPLPLPVIGTLWVFMTGRYSIKKIPDFYEDCFKKYGTIFKEEALFNVPVVSVVEKSDIEKVFKSCGKYPMRPPTEGIAHYRKSRPDRYASTGMVNEQGETWHNLRINLTSELISPKTIAGFVPEVEDIAEDWCSLIKLSRNPNGKIENIEELTNRLALEATCALVLGRRMGFLIPDSQTEITKSLAIAVHDHFIASRDTYFGLPFWKLIPTPTYKKLVEAEENIYSIALELIKNADEATKESTVFQSVLRAPVDDREKTAVIVDFIAAGIQTLSNSLVFLLHSIGSHQDVQDKLYESLVTTTNSPYLRACMNESFRLNAIVNCLCRIIDEEIEIGGYSLSPGTVVLCHTGLACKDDKNFSEACSYRPERWLGEEKAKTTAASPFLVIPFGSGRRVCPGKRFIEQILPVIVNSIIKNFEIECNGKLEVQFEFLMMPKGPISMTFKDRLLY